MKDPGSLLADPNNTKPLGVFLAIFVLFQAFGFAQKGGNKQRPNILFAISDDQSFAHTSFAGSAFVNTPAFDRVAGEGIYFTRCFAVSPGCAPSRSAIVTGRYPWQNEQSGQHASAWLKKYIPFIDMFKEAGYATGRTGKGVGPFHLAQSNRDSLFRDTDPAGPEYSRITYKKNKAKPKGYTGAMSKTDYFSNFRYFMEKVKGDHPFFFWYGGREPHRGYKKGSWKSMGKQLKDVEVPGFLPDNDVIRGDLLDYAVEIEWFDHHLEKMLRYLEQIGELENTIVIVTSDNGMPFPRAKANTYEYGIHVPMAIRYPKEFLEGKVIKNAISHLGIAPTLMEIAGINPKGMMPISGQSFLNQIVAKKAHSERIPETYTYSGRERHSSSRYQNYGYPQRSVQNNAYIYIWNMKPQRWPAGAPQRYDSKNNSQLLPINGINADGKYIGSMAAFTDIDDSPSKQYLLENAGTAATKSYYHLAVAKRPEFELYAHKTDPYCLENLAGNPKFSKVENELKSLLLKKLEATDDPRMVGPNKEIFETYTRYSPIRKFPKPSN